MISEGGRVRKWERSTVTTVVMPALGLRKCSAHFWSTGFFYFHAVAGRLVRRSRDFLMKNFCLSM